LWTRRRTKERFQRVGGLAQAGLPTLRVSWSRVRRDLIAYQTK
jgi:hypothetical protein